jgi:hypothetical protein
MHMRLMIIDFPLGRRRDPKRHALRKVPVRCIETRARVALGVQAQLHPRVLS